MALLNSTLFYVILFISALLFFHQMTILFYWCSNSFRVCWLIKLGFKLYEPLHYGFFTPPSWNVSQKSSKLDSLIHPRNCRPRKLLFEGLVPPWLASKSKLLCRRTILQFYVSPVWKCYCFFAKFIDGGVFFLQKIALKLSSVFPN